MSSITPAPQIDPPETAPPQPPAPPLPKKFWYTYQNGRTIITEDPQKYEYAENLLKKAAGADTASFANLRDFSILLGPKGERLINMIDSKGTGQSVPLNPNDSFFSSDAIDYLSGVVSAPPVQNSPVRSTNTLSPDPTAPRDPGHSPSSSNTQLAAPRVDPNPPPAIPQPASTDIAGLARNIEELRREVQAIPRHPFPPMIYPMHHAAPGALPAPGAPIAAPNNLNVQSLIQEQLRTCLARLRSFINQIPEENSRKAEYRFLITQIEQLPVNPKNSAELIDIQDRIYAHILNYLRPIFQGIPAHLQAHLTTLPDINQLQFQNLLNPFAGNAPSLIELLNLHDQVTHGIKVHLENKMVKIQLALQNELGIDQAQTYDLLLLREELNNSPILSRLNSMDREITDTFRNHILNKTTELNTSSQVLSNLPTFSYSNAAGLLPLTRDQLLLEPNLIRQEFNQYMQQRIVQLPQQIIEKIPRSLIHALINGTASLGDIHPQKFVNAFKSYLNAEISLLPKNARSQIRSLPEGNIQECRSKYDAIAQQIKAHLQTLIGNIPLNPPAPARNQRISDMLSEIGAAIPGGLQHADLRELSTELTAVAPNHPTLERLKKIQGPLERFAEQEKPFALRHPMITLVGVAAIGLMIYFTLKTCDFSSLNTMQECPAILSKATQDILGTAKETVCKVSQAVKDSGLPVFSKMGLQPGNLLNCSPL